MFQATIFGGHDGRLRFDKWFYLTLFGACDLTRPTVARQLLAQRQAEPGTHSMGRRTFFLTIFGAVDITSPTLAEEFIDLRETIDGGLLTMRDWDRAMADLGRLDISVASFTMFGGFDEYKLPSENQEVDSLAIQRHVGNISESAGHILQLGIGQGGAERRATVRRALADTAIVS